MSINYHKLNQIIGDLSEDGAKITGYIYAPMMCPWSAERVVIQEWIKGIVAKKPQTLIKRGTNFLWQFSMLLRKTFLENVAHGA